MNNDNINPKKIKPLDWSKIGSRLEGMEIGAALDELGKTLVNKMNEIVEDYNETINK